MDNLSSSSSTRSEAVSKNIEGPVDRKTITTRLKGLFWNLLNMPLRIFPILKDLVSSLFTNIRATISKEKESCKYKGIESWRKTCSEFQSRATEARLKTISSIEGERNYLDEVKTLVDNMHNNMERFASIGYGPLHESLMELSPVMFETMLQQIKKDGVIDEKLLNETKSFVDVFNRHLEAIEKGHPVESLLFPRVMWCKLALYIFNNVAIVDKVKTGFLTKWFFADWQPTVYVKDIDEKTETMIPKAYERFILFIKCWHRHGRNTLIFCPGLVDQLRKDGIRNIPDSWDTPDLLMRVIMKKMDRVCANPDQDDATFNEGLKEWETFIKTLALSRDTKTLDERIKDFCILLEPYIDNNNSKVLL